MVFIQHYSSTKPSFLYRSVICSGSRKLRRHSNFFYRDFIFTTGSSIIELQYIKPTFYILKYIFFFQLLNLHWSWMRAGRDSICPRLFSAIQVYDPVCLSVKPKISKSPRASTCQIFAKNILSFLLFFNQTTHILWLGRFLYHFYAKKPLELDSRERCY